VSYFGFGSVICTAFPALDDKRLHQEIREDMGEVRCVVLRIVSSRDGAVQHFAGASLPPSTSLSTVTYRSHQTPLPRDGGRVMYGIPYPPQPSAIFMSPSADRTVRQSDRCSIRPLPDKPVILVRTGTTWRVLAFTYLPFGEAHCGFTAQIARGVPPHDPCSHFVTQPCPTVQPLHGRSL
jgi:hypothetical protein